MRRFMISTTLLLVVGFFLFALFASIDKAADYLALGVEWLRTVTDARR